MLLNNHAPAGERVKVAILGGGMGALATAWRLMSTHPERYEITVYQRGWRLGGKGASGRNLDPGKGLRIEEHGLHILMGFYDNVFRILKTCYDDLAAAERREQPWHDVGPWSSALTGSDCIQICDRYRDGGSDFWELHLPAHPEQVPGTRLPGADIDVGLWIQHGLAFLYEILVHAGEDPASRRTLAHAAASARLRWLELAARTLTNHSQGRLRRELVRRAAQAGIEWALSVLMGRIGDPEQRDRATTIRRRQAMAGYFVGANLLGMIHHRLWHKRDFLRAAAALDEMDYRAWLRASAPMGQDWPELTWQSPLVNAVYDLIFSRQSGFAAGTALFDTLRMLLDYRGHVYYRMNGGMGDVVFAPLYLWLRQRGVRFQFFHRVRALHVDTLARERTIGAISVERQLDLGGHEYEPLIPARGRPCWPNAPLVDQFPTAERRRLLGSDHDFETSPATWGDTRTLRRGRDFDAVVLGIPVGALQAEPALAGELAEAWPPFAAMLRELRTVPTRAMQLWTNVDAATLGWQGSQAMLGSFERPFNSWADMSQVLPREDWQGTSVAGVQYFCDAHPDAAPASHQAVRDDAVCWIDRHMNRLLPNWSWDRLTGTGSGPARLDGQYWRANTNPSERYVLAAPGTTRYRLAPDESGFANLFLAGDWVKTELNAGCVEAAAMAGVGAAAAIEARVPGLLQALVPATPPPREFIEPAGGWVLRHPVRADRATTAVFVLRADPERLEALCRDQIERPSQGEATAVPWPRHAGLVLLACSDLPAVRSEEVGAASAGQFHEHDVAFFVPVEVRTRSGTRTIALACPYLFVDSMLGLIAGREIFGLPKLLARIDMDPSSEIGFGSGLHVVVTSDAIARQPGPSAEPADIRPATLVDVRPTGGVTSGGRALWRLLPALLGSPLAPFRWPPLVRRFRVDLPLITLKQVRDATAPAAASAQSLLLCPTTMDRIASVRRWRERFQVTLPRVATPNLGEALGLDAENEPELAFQLTYSLRMGLACPLLG